MNPEENPDKFLVVFDDGTFYIYFKNACIREAEMTSE